MGTIHLEPVIREMMLSDYDEVFAIWNSVDGLCVNDDDVRDRIALYLARNPGHCFVAIVDREIVGTVLCGHDGRRGVLRHLAVRPDHRCRGIGAELAGVSLAGLGRQGIQKCNIFVMNENTSALTFWRRLGFAPLEADYRTLQKPTTTRV